MTGAVEIPPLGAGFRYKQTELGVLVTPRHSKWAWTPEERRFRSAIVKDGNIVSMGYPKFGGIEDPGFIVDVAQVRAELEERGRIRLLEKRDGVLAIRSVVGSKVIFRTRGTHDGGLHAAHIRSLAPEILHDPEYRPDTSLLFELTHPEWRIVLEYPEPSLTLLGEIDHHSARLSTPEQVDHLAEELGSPRPETIWWEDSWKNLIKHIGSRRGEEGVVVVSHDGQTLVKVKSEFYRKLHSIRYVHEGRLLMELWDRCEWKDINDAKSWLAEHGVSFDLIPNLRPRVESLIATEDAAATRVTQLDQALLAEQMKQPGKSGAALTKVRDRASVNESAVLDLLHDGQEQAAYRRMRSALLENLLARWEDEDIQADRSNPPLA